MKFLSFFSLTGDWPTSRGHCLVITPYFLLSHLNSDVPSSQFLFHVEALKLTQSWYCYHHFWYRVSKRALEQHRGEQSLCYLAATCWKSLCFNRTGWWWWWWWFGGEEGHCHCKSTSCVVNSCVVYIMNPCPSPSTPPRPQPSNLTSFNKQKKRKVPQLSLMCPCQCLLLTLGGKLVSRRTGTPPMLPLTI